MASDKRNAKKGHRWLKIIGIVLGALLLVAAGLYVYATNHPQMIVGVIQKAMYTNGSSPNSFEPINPPMKGTKENGQYLISEVCYGKEYPNSYLDIIYPDEDVTVSRPTLFYFHGGGFFGGSKNMGDPMAANEATALLDDLCAQGYNIVNVDYALVPDYHFPVPLIQANQAIAYMLEHKDKYHLDMDNVVIMGSSAGAILTSQLGSVITNADYAQLVGVTPALKPAQVKALVIDDAPLDYDGFSLACKVLVGNYVGETIYLSSEEIGRYNNILHLTAEYPAAILLGSEYRHDMNVMYDRLTELGTEAILVDPLAELGLAQPHCFVASERVDPVAKDAFDRLTAFLARQTAAEQP